MTPEKERHLPPEVRIPAWVWWLAAALAIVGPLMLSGFWPEGAFFGGLAPTVFILTLCSARSHEFHPNTEMSLPPRSSIFRRDSYGWKRARRQAFLAAGICLALAIASDWWAFRFGGGDDYY